MIFGGDSLNLFKNYFLGQFSSFRMGFCCQMPHFWICLYAHISHNFYFLRNFLDMQGAHFRTSKYVLKYNAVYTSKVANKQSALFSRFFVTLKHSKEALSMLFPGKYEI